MAKFKNQLRPSKRKAQADTRFEKAPFPGLMAADSGKPLRAQTVRNRNEGSPGQALKRLPGLRTFGSPAAQTLASHTSFAGM